MTTIVSTVGINLLTSSIISTTKSICSLISYLGTSNQLTIKTILATLYCLDIEFTIGIIEQIVKELNGKHLCESIKKTLCGVNEILIKINDELISLKKAIEYHESKYANLWRSFVWDGNIETIKNCNKILKHRYHILFELLKINLLV